jgi:D-alanine-D-alanine ligase
VTEQIENVSQRACVALGTRGLVRVDLRLDANDQPWILEVNTIPGMTDHSLIPKAAAHMGIDFPSLCDRLVQSCRSSKTHKPHIFRSSISHRIVE